MQNFVPAQSGPALSVPVLCVFKHYTYLYCLYFSAFKILKIIVLIYLKCGDLFYNWRNEQYRRGLEAFVYTLCLDLRLPVSVFEKTLCPAVGKFSIYGETCIKWTPLGPSLVSA